MPFPAGLKTKKPPDLRFQELKKKTVPLETSSLTRKEG